MNGLKTQRVSVLGGELRFLRTGQGPTVVLLHTLRTQLEYFMPLMRALDLGLHGDDLAGDWIRRGSNGHEGNPSKNNGGRSLRSAQSARGSHRRDVGVWQPPRSYPRVSFVVPRVEDLDCCAGGVRGRGAANHARLRRP